MERHEARNLSNLMIKVLSASPELKDYKFSFRGGKLGSHTATLKFEVSTGNPTEAKANDRKTFEQYARSFGLDPQDFGRIFTYKFEHVQIAGISPNRPKFSVRGVYLSGRKQGKEFLFPADMVKRNMTGKVA